MPQLMPLMWILSPLVMVLLVFMFLLNYSVVDVMNIDYSKNSLSYSGPTWLW